MARQVVLSKTLAAASDNNIALNQTVLANAAFVLNGSTVSGGVATLDTQRRVIFTSAGNDLGITFTITGTNEAGATISEVVTGASGGAAATTQDFFKVTRVTASGNTAGNVKIGTNGTGSTRWFVPNKHADVFNIGVSYEIVSGAATGSVECTDDDVLMPIPIYQSGYSQTIPVPLVIYSPSGLSGIASNTQGVITHPCQGIRLTLTAGAGKAQLVLTPGGMRGP